MNLNEEEVEKEISLETEVEDNKEGASEKDLIEDPMDNKEKAIEEAIKEKTEPTEEKDFQTEPVQENKKKKKNKKKNTQKDETIIEEVNEIKVESEIPEDEPVSKVEEVKGDDTTNVIVETKKPKVKTIIILSVVVFFAMIFMSTIFALVNIGNDNIFSNIKVNGIDVSKQSKEDALNVVTEILNNRMALKEVTAKYGDINVKFIPSDIDFEFNIPQVMETAHEMGRANNILVNNYQILGLLISGKNVECEYTYNKDKLDGLINQIAIPDALVENSYHIEGNELIIEKGKSGVVIDKDKFADALIKCILTEANDFEIYTVSKEVEDINIDDVYNKVFVEPKDAYFTKENGKPHVYPHVLGISFDKEAAREVIKEQKAEYIIPLIIKNPNVLTNQIGAEAFPDVLASYTTKYDSTSTNRSENLRVACERINGKVLLPGEVFSYNQTLGKRTIQNGYKEAGVYNGGKVEMGVGGGICQISSTLYNAALISNMTIVERSNHGMPVGYVPPSRDATVSWGAIDLKFKNDRTYPVRIVASASSGIAKVEIYGIKEENEYEVIIESYTTGSYAASTKYEYVSNLPTGTQKVIQRGMNGYASVAYRILKLNGEVVSKTLLSQDRYSPMHKIVQVGK